MNCMRCTVDADEFRQALDKALKAAAKKTSLPFLEEALFRCDGSTCTLTCTNLELWCQASFPAQGEPCAFLLRDSRKLLTACKYFSGDLHISYTEDDPPKAFPDKTDLDGSLVLTCGDKELRQRVTSAEDYPRTPAVKAEQGYVCLSGSERIRAGLEVAEMVKKLMGVDYPVFIDDAERVPVIDNVRPSGQIFVAKVIKGAKLSVQMAGAAPAAQAA